LGSEIYHTFNEGNTLYALVWRKSDDKVWNNTDSQFDTYTDADIDKYDIALVGQVDSDYYVADFPSGISDSEQQAYRVQIFLQDGGSPHADDDVGIAQGEIFWNGSDEIDLGTINITNSTVTNVYDESTPPPVSVINETLRV